MTYSVKAQRFFALRPKSSEVPLRPTNRLSEPTPLSMEPSASRSPKPIRVKTYTHTNISRQGIIDYTGMETFVKEPKLAQLLRS